MVKSFEEQSITIARLPFSKIILSDQNQIFIKNIKNETFPLRKQIIAYFFIIMKISKPNSEKKRKKNNETVKGT